MLQLPCLGQKRQFSKGHNEIIIKCFGKKLYLLLSFVLLWICLMVIGYK